MMAFFGKNFIRVYLLVLGVLLTVAVYRQYTPADSAYPSASQEVNAGGWYGGGTNRVGFFIADNSGQSSRGIPVILGKLLQMVSRADSAKDTTTSMYDNPPIMHGGKPVAFGVNSQEFLPLTHEHAPYDPAVEPLADTKTGRPYGIQTEGEMELVGRVTQINQPDVCANDRNVTVLFLIQTSIGNRRTRDTIRLTWGGVAAHEYKQPVLFVIGRSNNATLEQQIAVEQQEYNDLIQFDFIDHYHNLTIKSLSCVLWTARFCPQVGFMLKVDDDTFVNSGNIVRFGHNHIGQRNTMFGQVRDDINPLRDPKYANTWYTPHAVFKADLYPPYTSGSAYLIGGDAIQSMARISDGPMVIYPDSEWTPLPGTDVSRSRGARPALIVEDQYIGGVLAVMAGVPRVHNDGVHQRFCDMDACNYKYSFTVHHCVPEQISKIWYYIKNFPDTNC